MKMFKKTVLAAALLVSAGYANAGMVTNSTTGGNEAFLMAYDSVQGKTFNLDLGVTFAQIVANASTALSAYSGAGLDLATAAASAANWGSFAAGITNVANVKYAVLVGSAADNSIVATGINSIVSNAAIDQTVLITTAATTINTHANEINVGMGASQSSVINQLPEVPYKGQMNHMNVNNVAADIWGGWNHNPLQTYGSAVDFWKAGFSVAMIDDGFGTIVPTNVFTNADVSSLGKFTLAAGKLSFAAPAVASVPLPAAVWMFGAGLMGVLRLNRRKAA